jgi:hypothetical protein
MKIQESTSTLYIYGMTIYKQKKFCVRVIQYEEAQNNLNIMDTYSELLQDNNCFY